MSCPVLTLDATPGAAPHSSIHPHFMHSGSDDSLRNSRPEASMLSSPNGLRSSKLANSWRSWRLDVTDDKNEVLRLRSFLCEAEEDVHHLSEDLIDAKQAQQRANQARHQPTHAVQHGRAGPAQEVAIQADQRGGAERTAAVTFLHSFARLWDARH
eukprot:2810875-Rhodomonas_salina.2